MGLSTCLYIFADLVMFIRLQNNISSSIIFCLVIVIIIIIIMLTFAGSFWDDWMRQPEQRKNRSCIRPEIPRTSTFGRKGTSG